MAKQLRMVTIGNVTLDTFLLGKALAAKRDVRTHDYVEQFPLGEKLPIEHLVFSVGGNAANTAVTFARQGLNTTFIGKIADDIPGREVLKMLSAEHINLNQVICNLDGMTAYSTILLAPNGERTILQFRGTAVKLEPADIKWSQLKTADWLYISSLPADGKLRKAILKTAKTMAIKVAYNPSEREITGPHAADILQSGTTILIGNKEEMQQLTGKDTMPELLRSLSEQVEYAVITDGDHGSWLVHQQTIYQQGLYKNVKVIDRTGAGDAFGSGLVAGLATGRGVEGALALAAANATAVVQQIGSQPGILSHDSEIQPVPITVKPL